jgi:hypothetical protein
LDDFSVCGRVGFIFRFVGKKPAAPMIGAESFWETVGPYFDASVGNHLELEACDFAVFWLRMQAELGAL